ncbi:MAG TPA: hypothetical protein VLF79_01910 [Candidatus Saccharimonadales bacterium]|nr:hypothetical protein [Candidatus Saccharimonadales bacterium]
MDYTENVKSTKQKNKIITTGEKSFHLSDMSKYFVILIPVVTLLIETVAYLRIEFTYLAVGIKIPPQLDQFSIILAGLTLGIILSFVALPTLFHLNKTSNISMLKYDVLFYLGLLIVAWILNSSSLFAQGGGLNNKLIGWACWFLLLVFIPLIISETLSSINKLDLYDRNFQISALKIIGIAITCGFSLTILITEQPISSLDTKLERNTVTIQKSNYVILGKQGQDYLLGKLCKDGSIKRGSFRFANIESVGDTTISKVALFPSSCGVK